MNLQIKTLRLNVSTHTIKKKKMNTGRKERTIFFLLLFNN